MIEENEKMIVVNLDKIVPVMASLFCMVVFIISGIIFGIFNLEMKAQIRELLEKRKEVITVYEQSDLVTRAMHLMEKDSDNTYEWWVKCEREYNSNRETLEEPRYYHSYIFHFKYNDTFYHGMQEVTLKSDNLDTLFQKVNAFMIELELNE